MDYLALAKRSARLAFEKAGNLVPSIQLTKVDASFDFNTEEVSSTATTITLPAIVSFKKRKTTDSSNKVSAEIIVLVEDLADVSIYDTAIINSENWKLTGEATNDGVLLKFYAEAV